MSCLVNSNKLHYPYSRRFALHCIGSNITPTPPRWIYFKFTISGRKTCLWECTVKAVFRRYFNTWENVSLHDRCPYMTGVPTWQIPERMCPYMTGVPTWQVSLQDRCPYMTGDPTRQVSLHDRCPYMTGVPTRHMSLHDRCPYTTGVPTRQVSLHNRCPYMTGVPTRRVSLHDGCPYTISVPTRQVSLYDRCPYTTLTWGRSLDTVMRNKSDRDQWVYQTSFTAD